MLKLFITCLAALAFIPQAIAQGTNYVDMRGAEYETVAASQTDQVLGGTGAAGDTLLRLVCDVNTAATSAVSIKDGAGTAITLLENNVGNGINVYVIEWGARSTAGGWSVTTGAGVSCVGIGQFTD